MNDETKIIMTNMANQLNNYVKRVDLMEVHIDKLNESIKLLAKGFEKLEQRILNIEHRFELIILDPVMMKDFLDSVKENNDGSNDEEEANNE